MMQIGMRLGFPWINQNTKCPSKFYNFADGTNVLSPSINFSRTTNATVTNSAGVITYAPHNLLTYSEQFDNTTNWTKTQTSVTANATIAPDGTTTADFIIPNTTTNQHGVNSIQQFTANTYTQTVYAKAGGYNFIILGSNQFANMFAWFNLATGQVGTKQSAIESSSITSVGNGWYRCSITSTYGGNTTYRTYSVANADNSFSFLGDGTSGVYLWGAQNELGSTATTYNSTTVKNLLGYSELFDNAAWTKSNSFVQTNLLTYSEAFDNAAWTGFGATVTANNIIAPNGYQTADKVTISGSDSLRNTNSILITTGNQYTVSISVKKNDFDWLRISVANAAALTNSVRVWFNLATGAVGSNTTSGTGWAFVSATITPQANDFYRITVCYTGTAPDNFVVLSSADGDASLTRAANGSSYYLWGAQLVQGSVAGDYRRTDAAALPVYYPNHNGVVCAEKLVEDTSSSAHRLFVSTTTIIGTSYTASIYAKAGERRYFTIRPELNADVAIFDLMLGIVISATSGVTATITSVGNGWYRCSARKTATTTTWNTFFCPSDNISGVNAYTGNGTSGIYIFGAQLSDSASLDPYVLNAAAAPTAAAYYGARFDYDPVTLAPKGLLIEEQRANLFLNSSLAGTNLATQSVTVTAVAHTLSFYGTGTVTLTGTAIATVVGTGAYPTRTTLTFTPTAGIVLFTVTSTVQYAQLEIGSFATSFIPTAASQVTRAADVATIQGSNFYSWYNQNEGTLSTNTTRASITQYGYYASINNGINNAINFIGWNNSTDRLSIVTNSSIEATLVNSVSNTLSKSAGSFIQNNINLSTNTNLATTDILATLPIVNKIDLGADPSRGFYLNGTIKSISYYPQRLSNETLKGLTA